MCEFDALNSVLHVRQDDYPREGYGAEDYDIDGTLKAITKGMLATTWTLLNPSIE